MKKKLLLIIICFLFLFVGFGVKAQTGCGDLTSKGETVCKGGKTSDNKVYDCKWNAKKKKCEYAGLKNIACGKGAKSVSIENICNGDVDAVAYDIPEVVPKLTAFVVNAMKIATPIILIFIGAIQILKALASSKEDEIKKAQSSLIKKLIIAVMIFFVITITQFVIDQVSDSTDDNEQASLGSCMQCFLNNNCQYKYIRDYHNRCTNLKTGETTVEAEVEEDDQNTASSNNENTNSDIQNVFDETIPRVNN